MGKHTEKLADRLTEKQRAVLYFIFKYKTVNEMPPTLREIGEHFKYTFMNAFFNIEALIKKGYIRKARNIPRGILLTETGKRETKAMRKEEIAKEKETNK